MESIFDVSAELATPVGGIAACQGFNAYRTHQPSYVPYTWQDHTDIGMNRCVAACRLAHVTNS